MKIPDSEIKAKAKRIKLLLTDCDGVLTDSGVYYSHQGEKLKRFSIRDGMGVERLRKIAGVETGIVTGEDSEIIRSRAKKLQIDLLYPGVKDKSKLLYEIMKERNLAADEIAYIGDDTNDIEIMKRVGLSACPGDATKFAKQVAEVIAESRGGYGAFRDFAELIIESHQTKINKP